MKMMARTVVQSVLAVILIFLGLGCRESTDFRARF
jgi:hypothetical protein